jgi:molecular chaperone DnaK
MYAQEDKKRKEEVDIRNNADQLVYQSEKTLKDVGDKLDESEKADVSAQIEKVKESLKGTDFDKIKADSEALSQKFFELSKKIYQNTGAPEQPSNSASAQDNVVDADYEEVDNDKK